MFGKTVVRDEFSPDSCTKCICKNSTLDCVTEKCPELNCNFNESPVTAEGECCPECIQHRPLVEPPLPHRRPSCLVEGAYIDPINPCLSCYCHNGYKSCYDTSRTCAPLTCEKTVKNPGKCCPECAEPKVSQEILTKDPGQVLTEDPGQVLTEPDQALTEPEEILAAAEPEDVELEISIAGEELCKSGKIDEFSLDSCTKCICKNNTLDCVTEKCPELNCNFNESPVTAEGECCPECIQHRPLVEPPLPHRRPSCLVEGAYIDPINPCLSCYCHNGYKSCYDTSRTCAPLTCEKTVKNPGKCCPECAEPKVLQEILTEDPGQVLTEDPGQVLTEDSGQVLTEDPGQVLTEPDQALTEPEEILAAAEPKDVELEMSIAGEELCKSGKTDEFSPDSCTKCICKNNTLDCVTEKCPELNCNFNESPVTAEGECCPECIQHRPLVEPPLPHRRPSCLVEGAYIDPINPCLSCYCHNGYKSCYDTSRTCAPLTCEKTVKNPGKCCPECAEPKVSQEILTEDPGQVLTGPEQILTAEPDQILTA